MWHAHIARDSRAGRACHSVKPHHYRSSLRLDRNTSRIAKTKERKNAKTNKCDAGDCRRNELYPVDGIEQLCSEIAQIDLHPGAGNGSVHATWTDIQYHAHYR